MFTQQLSFQEYNRNLEKNNKHIINLKMALVLTKYVLQNDFSQILLYI